LYSNLPQANKGTEILLTRYVESDKLKHLVTVSEPEDYVPPPQKANIGDILAQALELSAIKDETSATKPSGKKGKKMKGQKICLTGGRFSLN